MLPYAIFIKMVGQKFVQRNHVFHHQLRVDVLIMGLLLLLIFHLLAILVIVLNVMIILTRVTALTKDFQHLQTIIRAVASLTRHLVYQRNINVLHYQMQNSLAVQILFQDVIFLIQISVHVLRFVL